MNFIKLTLSIFLALMSEFTMAWDQDCGGSPGAQYACAYWSGYLDNIRSAEALLLSSEPSAGWRDSYQKSLV
ncbi:hypothetical protein MJO28_012878 [Puccinia striiformis f. sp. tritici]|uniref:Uncharacterized protein n=1 Tax=Puccinia striiformis f. sp. tritici TaxID=168172 RepID=A0ACC0DWN0_9BASI|nr:hypothetical protein MJO28_012878 [Puccinia striiformis f. sp. tritici]